MRLRRPVQRIVGEDIDTALADNQRRVLWACMGIPHALCSTFAEAPESGVADLEAADTIAVAVGKDGVLVAIGINPAGKARILQHAAGDAPFLLEVSVAGGDRR